MDGKEAVAQLAQEIADTFYPKTELPAREVFEKLVRSAKENYKCSSGLMGYSSYTKTVQVDGQEHSIEFHWVGHNASHEFSVGLLSDGRLIVRSCGESCEWDDELGCPKIETNVHVIGTAEKCRWPYVGQY